ncbi:MAG: class I SAM-dependent methyltransferase [Betaproteobacteria bacterium]|nr:class I SAM-dependent methyltransferase [Betaproteobacteria bacterium]
MIAGNWARHWCAVLMIFALCAQAQEPASKEFTPSIGQPGKDVVWVPSPQALIDKMLDMAKVTPEDYVIDLGSGDGRTVISAAKRGARALGIEYNPDMVALSRRNAEAALVSHRAAFVQGDIFESDLSQATVITLFLLPELNLKLRPAILSLKPGTRIASNTFTMGEWEPDESFSVGCVPYCTVHTWIVPARVEGRWKFAHGELVLRQEFQKLTGTLGNGGSTVPISGGRLRGDEIYFVAGDSEYHGRVLGNAIEGAAKSGGGTTAWRMRR